MTTPETTPELEACARAIALEIAKQQATNWTGETRAAFVNGTWPL